MMTTQKLLPQERYQYQPTSSKAQVTADEDHTKKSDLEWSFNIAGLVDDCPSVSSFDCGEEFTIDDDIDMFFLDWRTKESNSSAEHTKSEQCARDIYLV